MRNVRVGLIKAVPEKWNKAGNWRLLERLARAAARRGAEIMVTPECFLDGYVVAEKSCTPAKLRAAAERGERGRYVRKMKALAAELRIYLIAGFTDLPQGKDAYNAAYLFDRTGQVAGVYHKVQIYDHEKPYTPGNALPVFDVDFSAGAKRKASRCARIGILICADRRWPENARVLAVRGAEAILIPSYGMWSEANERWMLTRAYENGTYVCFAHPHVCFIANPKGDLEAKLLGNVPDVLVHDLDLDAVVHNHIEQRRWDLAGPLAAP